MSLQIQRIAAFSQGGEGGNPAGVVLTASPVTDAEMQSIAADVGYSETVFAYPLNKSCSSSWRVRYFSPESEVPFCGHATIALGAALGEYSGAGIYQLTINNAQISVTTEKSDDTFMVALMSPPTYSKPVNDDELSRVLSLFTLQTEDLSNQVAPAFIHGGSNHVMLPIKSRQKLAEMTYSVAQGKQLMEQLGLVTIMLVYIAREREFIVRNAFASGGVFEDPATGAAAAALAGYLRDIHWPHYGNFIIHQGEDMGCPSLIHVSLDDNPGSPVRVSGLTRKIEKGCVSDQV